MSKGSETWARVIMGDWELLPVDRSLGRSVSCRFDLSSTRFNAKIQRGQVVSVLRGLRAF